MDNWIGSCLTWSNTWEEKNIPQIWFASFLISVSVQCLKTPSEAINPQSQADMVTRVFWISVSLLESDYEHEFLMAIHLLNQVSTSLYCGAKPTLTSLGGHQKFVQRDLLPNARPELFPNYFCFHYFVNSRGERDSPVYRCTFIKWTVKCTSSSQSAF